MAFEVQDSIKKSFKEHERKAKSAALKNKKEKVARRFHHPGTKYMPIHPIHRGETKEE